MFRRGPETESGLHATEVAMLISELLNLHALN